MSVSLEWVQKNQALTNPSEYGPIWEKNTETFTGDHARLKGDGLAMLIDMIRTRRDYTVYDGRGTRKSVCNHYLRYLEKINFDLPGALATCSEVDLIPEHLKVETEDGIVSTDLLRKICYLEILQKHFKPETDAPVFMEIGAGIGSLARVIRSQYSRGQYIICDLPETLFYSYTYLNHIYPGSVYLVDDDNIQTIFKSPPLDTCFLLVPSRLRDQIPDIKIDLLMNTASLGEMANETCFAWFEFINTRNIGSVFLLNRYLNNWHTSNKSGNFSSILLDKCWNVLEWELDPVFLKSPCEEMEPNYLLKFATKNHGIEEIEAERRSKEYLDFAEQSFFVEKILTTPDAMKGKFHRPLFTGIDGPFYHYWQACRLGAGSDAIVRHIKFLRAYGPLEKNFEELSSYMSLLFLKDRSTFESLERVAKVWLYGAGDYGSLMLDFLSIVGIEVAGVVDGYNKGAWKGFTLLEPATLQRVAASDDIVLLTSDSWEAIASSLKGYNIKAKIATYGNIFKIEGTPSLQYLD